MITTFQYERLDYFFEELKLTHEEMKFIDAFLGDPGNDEKLPWLIDYLRKLRWR